MTKRIALALVLALLTFAPVATAEGFENPLAGVGEWLKGVAAAIAQIGGIVDPVGAPQGDEMGGFIGPQGSPQGDEMGGYIGPNGAPQNDPDPDPDGGGGDDEMGGHMDPWG